VARAPRRAYRSSQRISPTWVYLQTASANITPATKVLIGGFVPSVLSIEETILRTRIELFVKSDQSAAVEFQQGAFGLYVVSDLAFAAGAASIPGPVTNGSDDGWFVHQTIVGASEDTLGGGQYGTRYTIDSKAMRKVPEGSTIAIMIENAGALAAFNFIVGIRLLTKVTQG